MKKSLIYLFCISLIAVSACKDDDINIFEKSADERVAEAIASLKDDLVNPPNGWKVRYRPVDDGGSYFVYLKFLEDNKVTIDTDLGANDGEFHQQTIGYRIDNSLGLELIFENYSFFSYLFEIDQATFGAEYEFNYVNKTPNGELVFSSKTDFSNPTTLVFEEASANERITLAKTVSVNVDEFGDPLNLFTAASSRIAYTNKDIAIYLSLDVTKRVASFNYVSSKASVQGGIPLNLTTGYYLRRDSIVFESGVNVNFNGNNISLKRIFLNGFSETTANFCPSISTATPLYGGVTSSGDPVVLEQSLFNNQGASFQTRSEIYIADIQNIFDENGERAAAEIEQNLTGALFMVMYNNYQTETGIINALGFYIENADGSSSIAVHNYTSTVKGNVMELVFDPTVTFIRNTVSDADETKMLPYLNLMMEGGKAYVYQINDQFYEIYNPCSGWSFAFQTV
jgi:hypothetical protein